LVLGDASGSQSEVPLSKPEVTLGRSSSCDVVLLAGSVSRLHARINQRAGAWILTPVETHRNTYVNDELVAEPRLLHDGDRIQLADERLVYRSSEGSVAAAPSPSRRYVVVGAFAGLGVIALVAVMLYVRRAPLPAADVVQQRSAAQVDMASTAATAAAVDAARAQQQAETERQRQAELARQHEAELERQRAAEDERQRAAAQAERQKQIDKLLYAGDVAVLEHRYTTPADGSAVYAYRELLKIDPTNEHALSQTDKVIEDYLSWAESALAEGRRSQARVFAEKAAYVHEQIPAAGDAPRIDGRLAALQRALGAKD
jgi:pSer/pThr/pTyr-binding forkhead associated (FHA) protein